MSKFIIRVSQNGWEYTGYVELMATNIHVINSNTAVVQRGSDIFNIQFDEEIRVSTKDK